MSLKELKPSEWMSEIGKGLEYRRKYGIEDKWAQMEALLYNTDPSQANSGPNIMLSTLDALAASLNVPNPYITVKARRSDCLQKARVVESLDNLLRDQMGFQWEVERAISTAFLWGPGILKIGYDSEFGWDPTLDIGLSNPLGITASQHDKSFERRLEYSNVQPGMPWVSACLPHDIVVPWGTMSINRQGSARWVAHRIVRHIDVLKADLKYEHTSDLQPTMSMQDYVQSYSSTFRQYQFGKQESTNGMRMKGDQEYVEMWEIHDRATGKVYVIASGEERFFLRNEQDGLQTNGLPFVHFTFTPRTRSFWTTPDAYYLLYHQADLSDIAVQTTKHRQMQVLKFLYNRRMFKDQEIKDFFSNEIGIGIGFDGDEDLQKAVLPLNTPSPNLQLYQDAEVVRRNAREQVGFSKNQIGEFEASGRRTAREVNEVAQAAGLRLDRRQNCIRDMYVEAFKIINSYIFKYWTLPRAIEVMGEDGRPLFLDGVTGPMLKGEYGYQLGFSVGGNETLQERRATALQLLPLVFQIIQSTGADPQAAISWFARSINDPEFSGAFAPAAAGQGGGSPVRMGEGGPQPAPAPTEGGAY